MKNLTLLFISAIFAQVIFAQDFTITHDGLERIYTLHVPETINNTEPVPLIFGLHFRQGTGKSFQSVNPYDQFSERYNFIMVYPDGINGIWNIGVANPTIDDVGFINRVIDTLQTQYNIDTTRIFATGHSAGGIFSYELAAKLPGVFKAIAPVAGFSQVEYFDDTQLPTSIFHVHAMDDAAVNYNGDNNFDGVDTILYNWREINNCNNDFELFYDENGYTGKIWRSADANIDVSLFTTETGGHNIWGTPLVYQDFIIRYFMTHPGMEEIKMSSPNYDEYYDYKAPIQLSADIVSTDTIIKVEFYAGLNKISEVTSPPYSFNWDTDKQPGQFAIWAKAFTNRGDSITSLTPLRIWITRNTIATGKPAISSSGTASRAIDGDISTRWESASSDPQWICVNLEDYYTLDGSSIIWEAAYGKNSEILISDDFVNWSSEYKNSDFGGGTQYTPLDGIETKYLCLFGTERGTAWGYSIFEFEVYGDYVSEDNSPTEEISLEGTYELIENPSTNVFSLFENVSAIVVGTENYVLATNGFWSNSNTLQSGDITINDKDSLRVTGLLKNKEDSTGTIIKEIEIISIESLDKASTINSIVSNGISVKCFPNPFSVCTTFEYEINEKSTVELVIYNCNGAKIETLLIGEQEPGTHALKYDGSHLKQGVYYYQLITQNGINSGKLILTK